MGAAGFESLGLAFESEIEVVQEDELFLPLADGRIGVIDECRGPKISLLTTDPKTAFSSMLEDSR